MSRVGVYNGKALETMNKIMEYKTSWEANHIYKNINYDIYYYINNKGYLHVLRPYETKFNDVVYYKICDEMLTKDNVLKDTGNDRRFKTKEEMINWLNNQVNE